ncbi:hypothetical protein [Actinophytocola algeriensis]|uniref:Uncharacterized protein n=1 Tax=Actinophytocola algeriensis TaxID=1768010 RepID=A0A7W7Q874_9PSEU|nr:hypothetical protein [Actinophytocola algeriensis]MBB4908855.1 hypothetical protein [Actinophytocola algeriensis]MBE1474757.1 hypothetical protein [Actinophytocola algeriensis]
MASSAGGSVADELAAGGILWAPDFLVNAGGVIRGAVMDFHGGTMADTAVVAVSAPAHRYLPRPTPPGPTPRTRSPSQARRRIARTERRRAAS